MNQTGYVRVFFTSEDTIMKQLILSWLSTLLSNVSLKISVFAHNAQTEMSPLTPGDVFILKCINFMLFVKHLQESLCR
ncbi:hypothetical protein EXN66_Car000257 [Channa argus]|uniref:Uncharacterized protein n=1 Tax=Channa argus TaxID=215402 RepID=A0A6G1QX60_CHAAH|nr:hypothetical protein EXN66_Car000257 [Channa argus]